MSGIKSDLTNKTFQGKPMRSFEVPDVTEPAYDYGQDQGSSSGELDLAAINARLAAQGFPPLDAAGERAVAARNNQARNVRPAQSQDQFESMKALENDLAQARRVKATGRERLSEAAKRRVEMLCDLFSDVRSFDIMGQKFELKTVTGVSYRQALVASSVYDGTVELPFETRKQLLARSLTVISGAEVEMFLGDDSVEARMEFVDHLPEPILHRLLAEYQVLDTETKAKYAMKSADVQEVVSDLKK